MDVTQKQFMELLLQMLETEQGGVKVYETALQCVQNDELKQEWEKYRDETTQHVEIVTGLIKHFGGDPGAETRGRLVVRHIGQSLVKAMDMARKAGGPPEAAQLVAAECVVHAESKDHLNWELFGEAARGLKGKDATAVKDAREEVEQQVRAPLSQYGLVSGAVDRIAGLAGRAAAARGGERRQDRNRSRPRKEGAAGHAIDVRSWATLCGTAGAPHGARSTHPTIRDL